jgi:muramoyltetrapeptide carboxypeptidase
VSPAKYAARSTVAPALKILKSWGLKPVVTRHAFSEHHQFAGTDAQRAADLQQMLDDPDIRAVFCVRGGYGTTRIIDRLDFSRFLDNPKWVVGYSDITALHLHLHRLGVPSIHGTMPLLFARDTEASLQSLQSALVAAPATLTGRAFPNAERPPKSRKNLPKRTATGPLIGGNLSLLAHCIGTPSDVDTAGKILFLEDIGEHLYHIDRMMVQLKRAGKLANLAGLAVGHFTGMEDNEPPFGKTVEEIVLDAVQEYGYPVAFGFPIGHEPSNEAVVCGHTYLLKISGLEALLEPEPHPRPLSQGEGNVSRLAEPPI